MYHYNARNNPFAYRKPMVKKVPVKLTIVTADQVWAAAAMADRINEGNYFKEVVYENEVKVYDPNRSIMFQALNEWYEPTAEDLEMGRTARAWHKGRLLMTAIKRPFTGFEDNLNRAAMLDEFALELKRLELATIASQIRSYRLGSAEEQKMWGTDTTPMAPVGTKVECQIEVIKSVYSPAYNTIYIRAVTLDSRKVIMFTYREGMDPGTILTIKGTVKAHRDDCTQLNRVKVL